MIKGKRIDFSNNAGAFPGSGVDFDDIGGLYLAKRALEIAVAGSHHVLIVGPTGSGKTMLLKALSTMLGDNKEISPVRDWVLFLDELEHVEKSDLEILEQSLDDAPFILVAAMNNSIDPVTGRSYYENISRALLDRIDIKIGFKRVAAREIDDKRNLRYNTDDVATMKERLIMARKMQHNRFTNGMENREIFSNGKMGNKQVPEFCLIDPGITEFLQDAEDRLGLSAGGYYKLLKLARTAADLQGFLQIEKDHVLEALRYYSFTFTSER